ncbi:MAG TPA: hypothetical protein VE757_07070 [Gaiellaceae bacterium]|nr:hypothetical protein [Gaiellaceae bacterium]
MSDVLTAVLLPLPWLAAIAYVCWRAGLRTLLGADEAFPSQADQVRGFGAR